jgi:hypothetical protein
MPISAYVFIECTAGAARDVAKEVAKIQGVKRANATTGPYDRSGGGTGHQRPGRLHRDQDSRNLRCAENTDQCDCRLIGISD